MVHLLAEWILKLEDIYNFTSSTRAFLVLPSSVALSTTGLLDLGGVTVCEGTGQDISDKKVKYAEVRHRERISIEHDKIGVYMVRTPLRPFRAISLA